jgi:hypothetical protein
MQKAFIGMLTRSVSSKPQVRRKIEKYLNGANSQEQNAFSANQEMSHLSWNEILAFGSYPHHTPATCS